MSIFIIFLFFDQVYFNDIINNKNELFFLQEKID